MPMECVEGSVVSTVYRNSENGYSVIEVALGRRSITVVGILPELSPGEQGKFEGEYVNHPKFGKQLKCSSFELQKPTTLLGIERFLGSGLISGIGPSTAQKITRHFGKETLTVLSEHPERLSELKGLGKKRIQTIIESFHEHMRVREAMIFLQSYGIPATLCIRIAKYYGERTSTVIRENPYCLCSDIQGVGFLTADRIAAALGTPPDSPNRIRAALQYTLTDFALSQGHCYLPRNLLLERTVSLLQVEEGLIRRELSTLILDRTLVCEKGAEDAPVFLARYYDAEFEVSRTLLDLLSSVPRGSRNGADRKIDTFQKNRGIVFSPMQREAILCALEFGVLVITGGPGTGKTTIINGIISLLSREGPVLLAAPTGRAAKRMSEATGMEARTIHRLLEYSREEESFARDENYPLDCACLIVDEMSMVDLMLMRGLLKAVSPGTRLILVGDKDQLPSVGAGNVLGDILQSSVIPVIRLTDIFRQSGESRIVVNAHRILHGEMPLWNESGSDFFYERQSMPLQCAETVVELVRKRLPAYMHYTDGERMRLIQVLTPTKKGDCGVASLNTLLREVLNPPAPGKREFVWGDLLFREGDKVMQTRNNYDLVWVHEKSGEEGEGVFNGDIGFIQDLDPEKHTLSVLFDDERLVAYSPEDLQDLDMAYCLTIHKSQGSEFPVVVIPVMPGPMMLLTRNLFYTAVTRARSLVVLAGQESVVAQMVHNDHITARYTRLASRLREEGAAGK